MYSYGNYKKYLGIVMNKKIIFSILLLISKSAFSDIDTLLNNLNELDDKASEIINEFKQVLSREEKIKTILKILVDIIRVSEQKGPEVSEIVKESFGNIFSKESLESATDEDLDNALNILIMTSRSEERRVGKECR